MVCIVWFWKNFDADDQHKNESLRRRCCYDWCWRSSSINLSCRCGSCRLNWSRRWCLCLCIKRGCWRSWFAQLSRSSCSSCSSCFCRRGLTYLQVSAMRWRRHRDSLVWYRVPGMTNVSDMSNYATWNFKTTWVTRRHSEPQTSVTNFSACQYEMGVKVLNSACFELRPGPHGVFSANDQLFHWCFGYAPPPKQLSQINQTRTQIEMHLLSLLHASYVSNKKIRVWLSELLAIGPLAHWPIGPLAHWPWVLISSPTYRPCGQWRSTFHCAPAKLEVFGKCEWNAWTHIARWHMHLSSQAQPRFSLGPSLEASRSFPQPEITAKVEKVRGNPGRRIMQCENTLESARYKNIKKD